MTESSLIRFRHSSLVESSLMETDHFINLGYGWLCKHCYSPDELRSAAGAEEDTRHARFFTEGEAEDKEPALSTQGLAKWRDATRQTLICPRCSIEERVDKA